MVQRRQMYFTLLGIGLLLLDGGVAYALHPTTVIKKMEKEWNAIDTLRARVRQTYRDVENEPRTVYEGTMMVRRPRCLRFDFSQSIPGEVASASAEPSYDFTVFTTDGEYLYQYDRIENTLTQDNIEGLRAIPFLQAVAGIENFDAERFNRDFWVVSPVPEEVIDSVPVYLLQVRPREELRQTQRPFDLWVGCKDGLPRKIVLYLDQETVEVSLDEFVVNEAIPQDEFDVYIPVGVDLVPRAEQF